MVHSVTNNDGEAELPSRSSSHGTWSPGTNTSKASWKDQPLSLPQQGTASGSHLLVRACYCSILAAKVPSFSVVGKEGETDLSEDTNENSAVRAQ